MPYHAQRTGQITLTDRQPTSLRVHEVGDDGGPLCNAPIRPWYGRPIGGTPQLNTMVFTEQGEGEVTCLSCERTRHAQEEQGLRVVPGSRPRPAEWWHIREQLRSMKVGGRIGDNKVWVERKEIDSWVVHGHGGMQATARTADLAARLYSTEVAVGEEQR